MKKREKGCPSQQRSTQKEHLSPGDPTESPLGRFRPLIEEIVKADRFGVYRTRFRVFARYRGCHPSKWEEALLF
jgi:hypothetical protein